MDLRTIFILGILASLIGCAAPARDRDPRFSTEDNSPYDTELTFVSGLGMVDGTTCEVWPNRIDFTTEQPSGALALRDQLRGLNPGRTGALLGPVEEELRNRGISSADVFASRYGFEVRRLTPMAPLPGGANKAEGRFVVAALDPVTRTGFVLSRQWLCTETLARAEQCIEVQVDQKNFTIINAPNEGAISPIAPGDPSHYRVLMRAVVNAPEPNLLEPQIVLLAAPSVHIPRGAPGQRTKLDTHLIVIADDIDTGDLLVVPARAHVNGARDWMTELEPVPVGRTAFVVLAAASLSGSLELDTHAVEQVFVDREMSEGAAEFGAVELNTNGIHTFVPLSRPETAYSARRGLRIHPSELLRWTRNEAHSSVSTASPVLYRNPQAPGDVRYKWDAWTTETERIELSGIPLSARVTEGPTGFLAYGCTTCSISTANHPVAPVTRSFLEVRQLAFDLHYTISTGDYCSPIQHSNTVPTRNSIGSTWDCSWPLVLNDRRTTLVQSCFDTSAQDGPAFSCWCPPLEHRTCRQWGFFDFYQSTRTGPVHILSSYANAARFQTNYDAITQSITEEIEELFPPTPQRRSSATRAVTLRGRPVWPEGQLLSRGIWLRQMANLQDNESLRSGVPAMGWLDLLTRLEQDLPLDATGRPFSLDNEAQMAGALSIDSDTRMRIRLRGAQIRSGGARGVSANALGLPYGQYAASWTAPLNTNVSTLNLLEVRERWIHISDEIKRLANFVRDRSLDSEFLDTADRTQLLAEYLAQFAKDNRTALEANVERTRRSLVQLVTITASLEALQQDYVNQIQRIWECDPRQLDTAASDNCTVVMTRYLGALIADCPTNNILLDMLSAVGAVAAALGAVATGGAALAALLAVPALATLPDLIGNEQFGEALGIVHTVLTTAGTLEKLGTVLSSIAGVSGFMEKAVTFLGESNCEPGSVHYAHILNHLNTLTNLVTFLRSFEVQVLEAHTIIGKWSADIEYAAIALQSYQSLENRAGHIQADLALRVSERAPGAGPAVLLACPLAHTALRTALMDVYRANQTLQTSTGRVETTPRFHVPELPASYLASHPGQSLRADHGFSFSLWDVDRFETQIFNLSRPGSNANVSIVDRGLQRFAHLRSREICRVEDNVWPFVSAVVRKRIEGAALNAFLGRGPATADASSGRLNFRVSLDDLVAAVNGTADPHLNLAEAARLADVSQRSAVGSWVVLGTLYRGVDSSGRSVTVDPAQDPALVAGRNSVVPSEPTPTGCAPGARFEFSTKTVMAYDGSGPQVPRHVAICATTVEMNGPAISRLRFPATGVSDVLLLDTYRSGGTWCSEAPSSWVASGVEGRPVLGLWTMTHSVAGAQQILEERTQEPAFQPPSAAWAAQNAGLIAIEVYFIVGGELLSQGEPPRFRLVQ